MQDDKKLKKDIKSMLPEKIEADFKEMGLPKFRAVQVFSWLSRGVSGFGEMTNLSKELREQLAETYEISGPRLIKKQVSKIDGTVKYLWELHDKEAVETVIMRYKFGNSICISSQVGCRMGCRFCASTIGGLSRNLSGGEILDLVLFSENDFGERISNIVMMGIGEPLDNFDNVERFLQLVSHSAGRNVGMRHITISTCGLTELIDKLARLNLQLTLSVSLHAPDDETRSGLMPVNKSVGVKKLLDSCLKYQNRTGRRVSYEYAMIDGVNDSPEHAALLAEEMKRVKGHVNLIPLNHVDEREALKPSLPDAVSDFKKILEKSGINVTVRRRLGGDIDASCGQLRRKNQPGGFLMESFGLTDKGKVRKENQDTFLINKPLDRAMTVIAVCDGMGGAKAGSLASKMASECFMEYVNSKINEDEEFSAADVMSEAALKANSEIYEKSLSDFECRGMGTTMVAAICSEDETVIINIGDSRAYIIANDEITRITRDHSLVEDLVERGELTPDEARVHPKKNLITRALGVDEEVISDVFAPQLNQGDLLLLCTDGLSNMLEDEEILQMSRHHQDAQKLCRELLEESLNRGATDNVTAVVLKK